MILLIPGIGKSQARHRTEPGFLSVSHCLVHQPPSPCPGYLQGQLISQARQTALRATAPRSSAWGWLWGQTSILGQRLVRTKHYCGFAPSRPWARGCPWAEAHPERWGAQSRAGAGTGAPERTGQGRSRTRPSATVEGSRSKGGGEGAEVGAWQPAVSRGRAVLREPRPETPASARRFVRKPVSPRSQEARCKPAPSLPRAGYSRLQRYQSASASSERRAGRGNGAAKGRADLHAFTRAAPVIRSGR